MSGRGKPPFRGYFQNRGTRGRGRGRGGRQPQHTHHPPSPEPQPPSEEETPLQNALRQAVEAIANRVRSPSNSRPHSPKRSRSESTRQERRRSPSPRPHRSSRRSPTPRRRSRSPCRSRSPKRQRSHYDSPNLRSSDRHERAKSPKPSVWDIDLNAYKPILVPVARLKESFLILKTPDDVSFGCNLAAHLLCQDLDNLIKDQNVVDLCQWPHLDQTLFHKFNLQLLLLVQDCLSQDRPSCQTTFHLSEFPDVYL